MFDDRAFSRAAFSEASWLFAGLAAVRREVLRGWSIIARVIQGRSPL
jgi:hypothetical protein